MHKGNRSWNITSFRSVVPLPAVCLNVIVSGGCLNTEDFRVVSSPYSDLRIVGLEIVWGVNMSVEDSEVFFNSVAGGFIFFHPQAEHCRRTEVSITEKRSMSGVRCCSVCLHPLRFSIHQRTRSGAGLWVRTQLFAAAAGIFFLIRLLPLV